MIERRKLARQIVGLLIGRVDRGGETDVLGHHRKGGEQRHRFEMRDELNRAGDGVDMGFAHRAAVGKEHHVELGPLGSLSHLDVMLDVDVGVLLARGCRHDAT